MKSLTKKLENRIVVRLFAFMGIGAGLSAAVACLLTRVAEYRDFLAVPDAENNLMLSVSGWILLLLPLVLALVHHNRTFAVQKPAGRKAVFAMLCLTSFVILQGAGLYATFQMPS